jgi:hypothetical protein
VSGILQIMSHAHLPAWTTVRYRPPQVGIGLVDVELESAGAAPLEPLGSGIAASYAVPPSILLSADEAIELQIRVVDGWALASDGAQWVVQRQRSKSWVALKFVRLRILLNGPWAGQECHATSASA